MFGQKWPKKLKKCVNWPLTCIPLRGCYVQDARCWLASWAKLQLSSCAIVRQVSGKSCDSQELFRYTFKLVFHFYNFVCPKNRSKTGLKSLINLFRFISTYFHQNPSIPDPFRTIFHKNWETWGPKFSFARGANCRRGHFQICLSSHLHWILNF